MKKSIGDVVYRMNHWPVWRWPVTVWGNRMVPPSGDRLLHLWLNKLGRMNGEVRQTLRRLVQPGMTVLDIGANQGVFTLLLSSLVGSGGKVHAFEPEPSLFAALRANLDRNAITNVNALPIALGSAPGSLTLKRSVINSGDNRLGSSPTLASEVTVTLDTLDHALPDATADVIKIDVQGHELSAFQGGEALIGRSPNLKILFEYWPAAFTLEGKDPTALLRFFLDRGFKLYEPTDWSRPRELKHWVGRGVADILAVRG